MQSAVQTTNAMDDNLPLCTSHSAPDSIDVRTGIGRPEASDPGAATLTLTLAPLKSVQPYRTQDEFLVAMKEDLAEWLNTVYDLDMDENSLFSHLATGVLLCRHANAFNAVAVTTPDPGPATSRRNSGINSWSNNPSSSSLSTSGACPSVTSGGSSGSASVAPFSTPVPFRDGVHPGSFQSRDNIANFLRWCRHSVRLRDTLLFETEDLVQGRNERNVILCLLEVARRGSRIGMAAPSLVRLEAEIDAEIARDEAEAEAASRLMLLSNNAEEVSVAKRDDNDHHGNVEESVAKRDNDHHGNVEESVAKRGDNDHHGNDACVHHHGNDECNHDNEACQVLLQTDGGHGSDVMAVDGGKKRDAAMQTMDEAELMMMVEAASPPPGSSRQHPTFLHRKSSLESISSSSDSSSVRGGHAHPHPHPQHSQYHHSVQQAAAAAAAAAAASRQRRPVIEVDMMSLDEMVRNILNKCTCEFQYPMVRVSEGKYKIGDGLTLIFVRILRNHVMVRIGGGWDTLENYLHRHDPCRMETKVTKSSSGHTRIGAHACGGAGTSGSGVVGTGVGGSGVGGTGVTGEGGKDGSIPCDTFAKATNDRGSIEENPVLASSVGGTQQNDLMSNRPDVPSAINEVPILIGSHQADDLAPRDTVVSSQQSSLQQTIISDIDEADRSTATTLLDDGRRTRDVACQTDDPTLRRYSSSSGASSWESASRDERSGRVGLTGRIDVTLDVPSRRDIDPITTSPNSRIEDSDGSSADPVCSRQDYTPERDSPGHTSTGKPAPSGPGCPQCGQSAVSGKQTAGLCRTCRQRRGQQLRPASAKVTRQTPQCPSSTVSHAPGQTTVPCLGSSTQDKRFRTQRPASAQEKPRRLPVPDSEGVTPRAAVPVTQQRPSSAQGQRPRAVGGSASSAAQKQRRRTLGPAVIQEHLTLTSSPSSTPNQLTRTVGHTLGHDSSIRDQRRNSLGVTHSPGQLHQTLTPGTTQVLLLDNQQRPPRQQRVQRPASAQENRRFAKRSKPEEELLIVESSSSSAPRTTRRVGENTASGFSPAGFSHRPSTLTLPQSRAAVTKTKSQEDLTTKECAATNRLSPSGQAHGHQQRQRPASSRSTISTHGDRQLIRELFRMKKLDSATAAVGCSYDIPELVELPCEDPPLQPRPGSAQGSSGGLQTRPRKDPAAVVERNRSFSKIPKPAVMN